MKAPLGIVLAAGEGRRMGGPKALLLVDGQPLITQHVQRLHAAGCRPVVVAVRSPIAAQVRDLLGAASHVRVCVSDSDSMAVSLRLALESAPAEASGDRAVVISPVDMLPVRRSTLEALLTAASLDSVKVATPLYQGRGGHPVVARASVLQVLTDGYSGTLRDALQSAEPQRLRVVVDDPEVVSDLDTPSDLTERRPGVQPVFVRSSQAPEP